MQVPERVLRGVHGGQGCERGADSGGSTATFQHHAASTRHLHLPASPRLGGGLFLPPLHPAGPEPGLHVPR